MRIIGLLATVSALALTGIAGQAHTFPAVVTSGTTKAAPPLVGGTAKTLYTQNSNDAGTSIFSENFTSGSYTSYSQGADDFVVPKGKVWKVGEVDVTGVYFDGSGPSTQDITIYNDENGVPGKAVKKGSFTRLSCADNGGSFSCTLPRKVKLKAGHYWVSVVADINFTAGAGEWGWELSSVIHNDPAVWRNPGGGGSCETWTTLDECFGYSDDLMFGLKT
jgi:hypothetical protein